MPTSDKPLALVTGAAGGIGEATTARLIRDGNRVIALDLSADALDAMDRDMDHGGALITQACDLTKVEVLCRVLADLVEAHGPVTVLVNNAGVWPGARITELSDDIWQLNLAVNLTAPFVLIRELAPHMIDAGGGAIVNIASRNAFRSSTNNAGYDASKAGLVALTRTAAGELAKHDIRVNAVCPGVIATAADPGIHDELFKAAYTKLIPMDRYGDADEIAGVVAFLASSDASFMTGQAVTIDGGQIACQDNQRFMEITRLGN